VSGPLDQVAAALSVGADQPEEVLLRGSETEYRVNGEDDPDGDKNRNEKPESDGLDKRTQDPHRRPPFAKKAIWSGPVTILVVSVEKLNRV
jgi:hypothetical protein